MWIISMGNHRAAGCISERRRSSCSSFTCLHSFALAALCPDGTQVMPGVVGECMNCSIGSYRKKGVEDVCMMCPPNLTTGSVGSVTIADCDHGKSFDYFWLIDYLKHGLYELYSFQQIWSFYCNVFIHFVVWRYCSSPALFFLISVSQNKCKSFSEMAIGDCVLAKISHSDNHSDDNNDGNCNA